MSYPPVPHPPPSRPTTSTDSFTLLNSLTNLTLPTNATHFTLQYLIRRRVALLLGHWGDTLKDPAHRAVAYQVATH